MARKIPQLICQFSEPVCLQYLSFIVGQTHENDKEHAKLFAKMNASG